MKSAGVSAISVVQWLRWVKRGDQGQILEGEQSPYGCHLAGCTRCTLQPCGQCHQESEHLGSDSAELLDKLDLQGWPQTEGFKEGSGTSEQHVKILAKLKSHDLYE